MSYTNREIVDTPGGRTAAVSRSRRFSPGQFVTGALGILLLVGSADQAYRGVAGAVGVLLFLGGIFVAAGSGKILLNIGTERATGWFLLVVGALAIAATMLPTFVHSESEVASNDPYVR